MASANGHQRKESPPPPPPSTRTTTTTATTAHSSRIPPAALLIYPATLLVGSLFALISPTARLYHHPHQHNHADPLAPTIAADLNLSPPHNANVNVNVNYFARKNNVFNQYFVKLGWFWMTLAFLGVLVSQPAFTCTSRYFPRSSLKNLQQQRQQQQQQRLRRILQAILRYSLATLSWYLTTQWFFGPPIIDRGFVLTGGKCERAVQKVVSPEKLSQENVGKQVGTVLTAAACKAAGGDWRGGYDVSGHVFMLVLGSVVLGVEAFGGVYPSSSSSSEKEKLEDEDEDVVEDQGRSEWQDALRVWSLRFVCGVIGLSWWMLFMTAVWFHTWLEKWSGLFVALGTVYIIYFLPRTFAPWRNIVGIPGV